jgi:hypothetical protein
MRLRRFPLKGAIPAAWRSRFRDGTWLAPRLRRTACRLRQPPAGGDTGGPAKPVPRYPWYPAAPVSCVAGRAAARWSAEMNPSASMQCGLLGLGRDHADGGLCSANVPRPAASSFISLCRAHHRRDPSVRLSISGQHDATCHVPRASGGPRSEIKEEAKPGDIRGGGHPVPSPRPVRIRARGTRNKPASPPDAAAAIRLRPHGLRVVRRAVEN